MNHAFLREDALPCWFLSRLSQGNTNVPPQSLASSLPYDLLFTLFWVVIQSVPLLPSCKLDLTAIFAVWLLYTEPEGGREVLWKSGSQSRTGGEIVGYSRKHHNSAGCVTVWPDWDYSGRPDQKAQTGGKLEWRRSYGNEEVVWSGPGTRKTGNGPEIKSKYEKDVQRLRHNPRVKSKTRIERGDSVHEGKHGTTLNFPDEVLDVAKTDIC
ncbi:hypothetical protein DFH09DRAFT_1088394 [Mycena vulgaris]|nr:hypothetical protein DFH09DRAFT_1088394 [Mycena vulgaris]